MTENNTGIATKDQLKNPFGKRGLAKNINDATETLAKLDPNTRQNRLGLVCDDSGSMSGEAISNAHTAVSNFCSNCKPQETSICIYPLNASKKELICDYDILTIYWNSINATGGTPLYTKLDEMIENEKITRAVVFSDGGPTDGRIWIDGDLFGNNSVDNEKVKEIINKYKSKEIPIDCIFIGLKDSTGYKELELLAKLTNGIFVHFTDSKSLSTSLKYLTPGLRGLLANSEIKEKIQRGEKI